MWPIDGIKSALIKKELIKTISALDLKPIAGNVMRVLDVQLVEKDLDEVKAEIKLKMIEFIRGLDGTPKVDK